MLTDHKIRGLVGSQNSLQDLAINLYTSVVDFIYFCRPVEPSLDRGIPPELPFDGLLIQIHRKACGYLL